MIIGIVHGMTFGYDVITGYKYYYEPIINRKTRRKKKSNGDKRISENNK